jgi:choline dehydrogenase-like flavoprotein
VEEKASHYPYHQHLLLSDKQAASASKEVILCSGAIDTPKLLLLNGIGPKSELEQLGITVKKDIPGIGKHLQDHVLAFMSVEVSGSVNERTIYESNAQLVAEAEALYKKDRTGALAMQLGSLWGGFMKLPGLEGLLEFKALPSNEKAFLTHDAVPTYEMMSNLMLWPPGAKLEEGNTYVTIIAFLMNPQSEGSVTLRSAKPSDKPVIKLNYLTHPYDAIVFREAIRNSWQKLLLNAVVAPHIKRTLCGPKTLSDEDIDAFAASNANTVWHANGTVKMGREGEEGACVDSRFRVLGVEGLRVADLSVCPLTTNNHTQSTAYLVGRKCAEKLVGEYGLDRK